MVKMIRNPTVKTDKALNMSALIIGNSDGIGLALTQELLDRGWQVIGISSSNSPIDDSSYAHVVAEVQKADYASTLQSVLEQYQALDLCVYCAGIGEQLDLNRMEVEQHIFDVKDVK